MNCARSYDFRYVLETRARSYVYADVVVAPLSVRIYCGHFTLVI